MTRTIAFEIGADSDAFISEAMRNEHPPSLVVHSGQTELVLTIGTGRTGGRLRPARAGAGGLAGQPVRDEPTMTKPAPQIDLPQGTLITMRSGDWKYGSGTLRLRVNRVMHEINRYEPGWIWVEGTRHDNERGQHWLQALVRIDALPR